MPIGTQPTQAMLVGSQRGSRIEVRARPTPTHLHKGIWGPNLCTVNNTSTRTRQYVGIVAKSQLLAAATKLQKINVFSFVVATASQSR